MKPFNLEAAKRGAELVTRDGRKARLASWKIRDAEFPLTAVIEDTDGTEFTETYTAEGTVSKDPCVRYDTDLFLAPVKRAGWVNVYRNTDYPTGVSIGNVYETKEEAVKGRGCGYIDTIKIEWEE